MPAVITANALVAKRPAQLTDEAAIIALASDLGQLSEEDQARVVAHTEVRDQGEIRHLDDQFAHPWSALAPSLLQELRIHQPTEVTAPVLGTASAARTRHGFRQYREVLPRGQHRLFYSWDRQPGEPVQGSRHPRRSTALRSAMPLPHWLAVSSHANVLQGLHQLAWADGVLSGEEHVMTGTLIRRLGHQLSGAHKARSRAPGREDPSGP